MSRFVRNATLLSVCSILVAATASAQMPSPSFSSGPGMGGEAAFLNVVGTPSVGTTHAHPNTVTGSVIETYKIKDINGNVIPGCVLEFNFNACSDMKLCKVAATNPGVSTTVDCPTPATGIVRATTNALGEVKVAFLGGGFVAPPPNPSPPFPGPGLGCVSVTATVNFNSVALPNVTAVVFDLNGNIATPPTNNGVNGGDMSVLKADMGQIAATLGAYLGRVDYSSRDGCGVASDCGVNNGLDVSYYVPILGQSAALTGSAQGCRDASGIASYCP